MQYTFSYRMARIYHLPIIYKTSQPTAKALDQTLDTITTFQQGQIAQAFFLVFFSLPPFVVAPGWIRAIISSLVIR